MKRYSELIPDEIINELLGIAEAEKVSSFRLGDITNELIEGHPDVEHQIIYLAVGTFVGKASRTVREYAAVAKFYKPATRREYEILSFDHFRLAMRYGDKWQEALEWVMSGFDTQIQRPENIDAMESTWEKHLTASNYPEEDQEAELRRVLDKLKNILYGSKSLSAEIIRPIIELIDRVESLFKIPA